MGTTTANMSIYVPEQGETLYTAQFLAGMQRIDTHDHSGAPDNGVQIGTDGIQDGAITPDKLSVDVGTEVTQATTNGTATQAAAVSVAQGDCKTVTGRFAFMRDDTTSGGGGTFWATFRRPTAGNVTLIGSQVVNVNEDATGSPTITITADIGNQTIDINCVGVAATNFDWTIFYNVTTAPG